MSKPFLHTLSRADQKDLLRFSAENTGLPEYVLEKDYYVSLVLKLLFEEFKPQHMQQTSTPIMFKGGTTLSKVYGCIDRMSEDIDLSLDMAFLGHPEPDGPESGTKRKARIEDLNEAANACVKDQIAPFLREHLQELVGGISVEVIENSADIEIYYPRITDVDASGYIQPRVLLECGGKAGLEPSIQAQIEPMVLAGIQTDHDDGCTVDVLGCDRTFFEKLTALHEINHRGVEYLRDHQSRHIYDVVSIHTQNPHFINNHALLARVLDHKHKYFRRNTMWRDAGAGNLKIVPDGAVATELERDWNLMREMFPGDLPFTFPELIERLEMINEAINN